MLYTDETAETKPKKVISEVLSTLMQPAKLVCVTEIPKLGSGKTDFKAVKQLALVG